MRRLECLVAASIDGFVAREDGDLTPPLLSGDYLQTLAEELPETFPAQARHALGIDAPNRRYDTVLMGAATYRVPGGLPSPYPQLRRYAACRSGLDTPADIAVTSAGLLDRVRALEAEDGLSIWLCGGSPSPRRCCPRSTRRSPR